MSDPDATTISTTATMTIVYPTGDPLNRKKYVGQCADGRRHGKGTTWWLDGAHYEGDWANDIRSGEGTYTWPDGDAYTGRWVDGEEDGYGVFTWNDGDRHEGQFRNGERHGSGTMYFAHDRYKTVGKWKAGLACGLNVRISPHGRVKCRIFDDAGNMRRQYSPVQPLLVLCVEYVARRRERFVPLYARLPDELVDLLHKCKKS